MKLLHDAIATRLSPGDAVVIGCDFNCSDTDPQLSAIKASCFVVQLKPATLFTSEDGKSCFFDRRLLSLKCSLLLLVTELVGQACDLGYFVFALVRGSAPANTANICFVTVDLSSEASIRQVTLKHDCVTRSSFHL